jgi:hypothetical protein
MTMGWRASRVWAILVGVGLLLLLGCLGFLALAARRAVGWIGRPSAMPGA